MARGGAASDLYDEFVEEARHHKGPVCSLSRALEQMDKTEREALDRAMGDPMITATAIASVLKRRGHDVKSGAVRRHRRGACCGQ